MNYKIKLISILFIASPVSLYAQKIYLGSCTTRDGGQYKGEMSGGKPNGKGTTIFKTGDTYEGSYLKGKRDGYGVYTFADGEKYEGQWTQDQQNGRGTYYFQNNNKYVGLWFRDYQHGHGIMYYYNHTSMMATGIWTSDRVVVLILIPTVLTTKVNGLMT